MQRSKTAKPSVRPPLPFRSLLRARQALSFTGCDVGFPLWHRIEESVGGCGGGFRYGTRLVLTKPWVPTSGPRLALRAWFEWCMLSEVMAIPRHRATPGGSCRASARDPYRHQSASIARNHRNIDCWEVIGATSDKRSPAVLPVVEYGGAQFWLEKQPWLGSGRLLPGYMRHETAVPFRSLVGGWEPPRAKEGPRGSCPLA
eukprot:scaffold996_cov409-Prasinococcus_capsulatus_cf.AAC.5